MNKNHSQNSSEENLERFARTVLQSAVLTNEEVEAIAASPQLWRRLQNSIAEEKFHRQKPRFFGWRWQWATAGALAIIIMTGASLWFFNSAKTEIAFVAADEKIGVSAENFSPPETKKVTPQVIAAPIAKHKTVAGKAEKILSQSAPGIKSERVRPVAQKSAKTTLAGTPKTEIATEFIALSYLSAAESGQVVRVKVPRSMMVSLGVTTKVEHSSELINAEVIVGDDGGARAIRFLANE